MKHLLLLIAISNGFLFAQNFADPDKYLTEKLDWEKLNERDSLLVDSCMTLYQQAKSDTARMNAINVIIDQSWNENVWPLYNQWIYDFSTEKLDEDIDPAVAIFMRKSQANALGNMAYLENVKGNSLKALERFQENLDILLLLKDNVSAAKTLNNIGAIYDDLGDIPAALDYYHQSLKMKEDLGDSVGIANSLNNIGYAYMIQNDFKTAISYYERSLDIRISMKDFLGESNSYNNLGIVYNKLGDQEKALEYHTKALNLRKKIGDKKSISISLSNIGWIFYEVGNYQEAEGYLLESIRYGDSCQSKAALVQAYTAIAWVYHDSNQASKAEQYGALAYKMSKELENPDRIRKSANLLAEVRAKAGNFKSAYELFREFVQMDKMLTNEENYRAARSQEAKLKYELKHASDSIEFAKESELQEARLAKKDAELGIKRNQQWGLLIGLLFVAIFAGFIYNRFRVTSKQKKIIELQKEIVVEQHKEISDSIQYAKRIQAAILPSSDRLNKSLGSGFVLFLPKDVVSGDFYWMEEKDGWVYFAVADCTGHGVPGAMVSVVCSNALSKALLEEDITQPAKILDRARELVIQRFARSDEQVMDGMDISLCALKGKQLQWAGAHNPLWIIRKNEVVEIKADKQPVGNYQMASPFTNHELELQSKDRIYLFSDGYQDQFGGEKGKKFRSKNLQDQFIALADRPITTQDQELEEVLNRWMGDHEQIDDICIIGLEIS